MTVSICFLLPQAGKDHGNGPTDGCYSTNDGRFLGLRGRVRLDMIICGCFLAEGKSFVAFDEMIDRYQGYSSTNGMMPMMNRA